MNARTEDSDAQPLLIANPDFSRTTTAIARSAKC